MAYAFGAVYVRVDEEGVFRRNFFLASTRWTWGEIDTGEAATVNYQYKDSSGWVSWRNRNVINYFRGPRRISLNAHDRGPENWWNDVLQLSAKKLGEKFFNGL